MLKGKPKHFLFAKDQSLKHKIRQIRIILSRKFKRHRSFLLSYYIRVGYLEVIS